MRSRKLLFVLLLFGLLNALAASLPRLAPKDAVLVLYTQNLGIKKPFLTDFALALKREGLTLEDLIKLLGGEEIPEDDEEARIFFELFTLDTVGREGLIALYPDLSLLILARPSAARAPEILEKFKRLVDEPKEVAGWKVGEMSDGVLLGYRDDTLLLAFAPSTEGGHLALRVIDPAYPKGVELPLTGDLSAYLDPTPLYPLLGVKELEAFKGYASSFNIVRQGLEGRSLFLLDPEVSPELAGPFLTRCRPWPLDELPQADAVTSLCFPFKKLIEGVLALLDLEEEAAGFDPAVIGDRLALFQIYPEEAEPADALDKPLGDMLILLESPEPLTAEANLLGLLQVLAAASTPEGEGGFKVSRYQVGPYTGKKVTLGLGQPLFLFVLEDRLALASSEAAAEILTHPPLAEDQAFALRRYLYPEDAVAESFSRIAPAFRLAAKQLLVTPLFVEEAEDIQAAMEFAKRLARFLEFVAERAGYGVGYTQITGNARAGRQLLELRW